MLITACATANINLPSVTDTPTGEVLPGKVVWRDLLTHDPEQSQKFYETLFGWEFENIGSAAGLSRDSAYMLIRHKGRLIGGMIDTMALNNRNDISQWVVSMSVEDVEAAAAAGCDDVRVYGSVGYSSYHGYGGYYGGPRYGTSVAVGGRIY